MIERAVKVEGGAERPDAGEDEVQLVELLGAVHGNVGGDDERLEEPAEGLDVGPLPGEFIVNILIWMRTCL